MEETGEAKRTEDKKKKKVVVVMGSTGVGKSQLSIDLALALAKQEGHAAAEVINADSMQVYRGFPIATAKVTEEEKAGVAHHLLDVAEPTDINFNVIEFCRLAFAAIDDIHSRGNLPIVVGGTHYYLEALLWENVLLHAVDAPLVAKNQHQHEGDSEEAVKHDEEKDTRGEEPTLAKLYERLMQVDPLMASYLHPHNERKIKRALEVFDATGRPYSDQLRQQAPPTPRYDALLFWIDCDKAVLHTRLDRRVDKMVRAGLLDEVADLRRLFVQSGLRMDYTKGILQAIGYKEFAPYFAVTEKEGAGEEEKDAALQACVAALKQRTRKYAKVQISWINRHFRPRTTIHRLDSSRYEQQRWNEEVQQPAVQVLSRWRAGLADVEPTPHVEVLRPQASLKRPTSENRRDEASCDDESSEASKRNKAEGEVSEGGRSEALESRWRRFVCEDCEGKVLQGEVQWRAHLASRGHHHHRKRRRQQALMIGITTSAAAATTDEPQS